MNKISCDICLDLIPLVQDDIASEDSRIAVINHLAECESCNLIYNTDELAESKVNDKRVIFKIKKQLYLAALIIIVLGIAIGVALTDGMGMFYNILIMPTIGALGYFVFRKKSYYVPLVIFVLVYFWLLIKFAIEGMFAYTHVLAALLNPAYWALIYSGLCLLGILIAFLLEIAFRKEKTNEKEE